VNSKLGRKNFDQPSFHCEIDNTITACAQSAEGALRLAAYTSHNKKEKSMFTFKSIALAAAIVFGLVTLAPAAPRYQLRGTDTSGSTEATSFQDKFTVAY
jgi:hypothetical protein